MNPKLLSDVLSYARERLDYLEYVYRYMPMCSHDWADIKQDILIHVWKKSDQIDPVRGYQAWVKTVISRAFQNEICQRTLSRSPKSRVYKMAVARPIPLVSRVEQIDESGEDEIVWEPDAAASVDNITPEDRARVTKIIDKLDPKYGNAIRAYDELGTWRAAGKRLGVTGFCAHERAHRGIAQIRAELAIDS